MQITKLREEYKDTRAEKQQWVELYHRMVLLRRLDEKLLHLQRQGRIRSCLPSIGQEAATIGSVSALKPRDWIVPALRESGVALYRGMSLPSYLGQLFGNSLDPTKGRQSPGHVSFRAANVLSTSGCVGTQLTHAVGIAMALKYRKEDAVVLAYLGDGATSESDFHAALNCAGVFNVPVVFFCQNNQFAISLPVSRQTAATSLAIKASAYGFEGYRIDGNDLLEVRKATSRAVEEARTNRGPKFIEAVTYRLSEHASSDDSSRYRNENELREWKKKDPLHLFSRFLRKQGLWTKKEDEDLKAKIDGEISAAIKVVEGKGKRLELDTLVEDVFETVPAGLQEELNEVYESLKGF